MSLPCLYVGIPLSRKELEEANNCVSHILCPGEGVSAKSTPQIYSNDYTIDIRHDHGHSCSTVNLVHLHLLQSHMRGVRDYIITFYAKFNCCQNFLVYSNFLQCPRQTVVLIVRSTLFWPHGNSCLMSFCVHDCLTPKPTDMWHA